MAAARPLPDDPGPPMGDRTRPADGLALEVARLLLAFARDHPPPWPEREAPPKKARRQQP